MRRYRILFIAGWYYAEWKAGWFWHKLPEYSNWVGEGYRCGTRERALELIEADKARLVKWAAIPEIEEVT